MKLALMLLTGFYFSGSVMAGTIFNISLPPSPQPSVGTAAPVSATAPAAQVSTKPEQSAWPAMPAATQSDRRSDESADAYQIRMNTVSQQALADLARISQEQNEKIRALAPK